MYQAFALHPVQGHNSNIGRGNLYVDGPLNPIPGVADLDECADAEMHDCPIGMNYPYFRSNPGV